MVAALSDQFNHLVERVIVIDCRYPYEFEGGHIKVSENLQTCLFFESIKTLLYFLGITCSSFPPEICRHIHYNQFYDILF